MIKNYNIEQTKITPKVSLKLDEGSFIIEGDSRPEDVMEFYTPILEWFAELEHSCIAASHEKFSYSTIFALEYLNSSSVIFVSKLLKQLMTLSTLENVDLNVLWLYIEHDEEMKELGEEFKVIYSDLPLTVKSKS
ncbi:MAG: DUF1987 domain-containing protein [Flavobacteriales bacterium]|jgi:hypothetical protein|nr:DUF1987 domain-containing protein [Flavobacteriales bacterium]